MKRIRGVIFDMDGLLFDTEAIYYQANQKIADEMGLPYTEEYYVRFLGVSDEELHQHYFTDFAEFGKETVEKFIQKGYEEVLQRFELGNVPVKKGAFELLDQLEKHSIEKVVASSNLKKFIDILLKNANLTHRFKGIVSADDVAFAKPDPEIFKKAARVLHVPLEEIVVLEDSINGIRASYSTGIDVIMVPDLLPPSKEAEKKTLAIFSNLHEVSDFFFS